MWRYKVDILAKLKEHGYSTYQLRNDKLISERVLTRIRHKEEISFEMLDRICKLLECEIGDILECNVKEDTPEE